jgi:succinyl-diaminopimelate desuccinylase
MASSTSHAPAPLAVEDVLEILVAADSSNPPGDERAMADAVVGLAARLGLPAPRRLARTPSRPNLLIEIGHDGPTLLLAAHMDTVPADAQEWRGDPWRLRRAGGLTGLGAVDMKGSIAALLLALADRHASGRPGRVLAVLTADEEAGSAEGMRWLVDAGLVAADAAAVLEPAATGRASWEKLFVAERGLCLLELTASGRPGHSSGEVPRHERAPWLLITALTALGESALFDDVRHPVDGSRPRMNVGTVLRGSEVATVYPSVAAASIELRTVPGMSEASVLSELRGALAALDGGDRLDVKLVSWSPPSVPVDDARLLGAARAAWEAVLGTSPASGAYPAGTDAIALLEAGVPTISAFGPGTLAVVHQPEERLAVADLHVAVKLFTALMENYHR